MMTDKQMRKAFEKEYPKPGDAVYDESLNWYVWAGNRSVEHPYNARWECWQDGAEWQAQQAAGAEPVAWTLQWPSDRKYGTVNYMTTFGSSENAEYYADQAGRDHRGNRDKDVTVVPLYTQPQPPKAVPDIHVDFGELRRALGFFGIAQPESNEELGERALSYMRRVIKKAAEADAFGLYITDHHSPSTAEEDT